jgi:2-oxoisovalerate dehydrogenase E2 component (dihydrolipoyl transacylase)
MTVHVIRVPDIGEGIAEVELVAWHVQPGDAIAEDQGLADVMTDKASVEIPSPVAGKVLELGGEVGQMLAVGSELIRIEIQDAAQRAPPPARASRACTTPRHNPHEHKPHQRTHRTDRTRNPGDLPRPRRRPIASPAVRARAGVGIDLRDVAATGTAGRIVQADLDAHAARRAAPRRRAGGGTRRDDEHG